MEPPRVDLSQSILMPIKPLQTERVCPLIWLFKVCLTLIIVPYPFQIIWTHTHAWTFWDPFLKRTWKPHSRNTWLIMFCIKGWNLRWTWIFQCNPKCSLTRNDKNKQISYTFSLRGTIICFCNTSAFQWHENIWDPRETSYLWRNHDQKIHKSPLVR